MAQQFSGLPIKSLIGAPLIAAAEANSKMALTQTQFLLSTCFNVVTVPEKPEVSAKDAVPAQGTTPAQPAVYASPAIPAHEAYEPIMINMSLSRPVINIDGTAAAPAVSTFSLPLLTILPLNSLAVDDVKVHFEMEVKSSFSNDKETTSESTSAAEGKFSARVGFGCFSAEVSGSVSASSKNTSSDKSHYEKSNSAKYEIEVHAGQLPLPQGVTTIIEAFSQAISPIQLKAA